jgi:hypothetical protein
MSPSTPRPRIFSLVNETEPDATHRHREHGGTGQNLVPSDASIQAILVSTHLVGIAVNMSCKTTGASLGPQVDTRFSTREGYFWSEIASQT